MIWQSTIFIVISFLSPIVFILSFLQSKKNKAFDETPWLLPWGIFVWGDGLVFAPFWFVTSLMCFMLSDTTLFLFIYCMFWVVRSFGEVIYWLHEQFATHHRNDPKNLRGYSIVKNDSVYFLYQTVWQCLMVISIIFSIYFGVMWVKGMI